MVVKAVRDLRGRIKMLYSAMPETSSCATFKKIKEILVTGKYIA